MLFRAVIAAILFCVAPQTFAFAEYPTQSVRIVVAYPPGGGTDILARFLAESLSKRWGQSAFVDNRGGGTGIIGTEIITKSPADGYSLLFAASQEIVINPFYFKDTPYDPLKDLTPVTLVARTPNVLMTLPSSPANNLKEFIALAKQQSGKMSYSSTGFGSAQHVAGELFKRVAGINLIHVPYKGGGPQIGALMGGQTSAAIVALPAAIQFIREGRFKALAVTTATRSPALPDVPTMAEMGLPGIDVSQWYGVFLPRGASPSIVKELNADYVSAIGQPELKSKILSMGYEAMGDTPQQFQNFVREETAKYQKIIADTKITDQR